MTSKEQRMARMYVHGMHMEDIGAKFNCTQNTVRNKMEGFLPTNQIVEEFKRNYVAERLLEAEKRDELREQT